MKTPVLETRRKVMTTVANAYPGGRDKDPGASAPQEQPSLVDEKEEELDW